MTSKTDKIILDIYRELYANSEPKGDFDKLMEEAELDEDGRKIIPFMEYEISEEKYEEIMKKHLDGKRLTPLTKRSIRVQICLGASPRFKK